MRAAYALQPCHRRPLAGESWPGSGGMLLERQAPCSPVAALDLNTAVGVATLVAVVTGFAFSITQLRQQERNRREAAMIQFVDQHQSPEFSRAFRIIKNLPDGLSGEELAKDPAFEDAAILVGGRYETLGLLVYERVLPIEVIESMIGGMVRVSWGKLKPYAEWRRETARTDKPFEWTQWLAERLAERVTPDLDRGAHVRFRDWSP